LLHQEGSASGNALVTEILAEVWADPELCLQAYQYAAIRHLVRQAAQMSGTTASTEKLTAVEAAFRADRGLSEQTAFEQWLKQHGMSAEEFAALIENEALLHESSLTPCPFPHRWMVDWLRITGRYQPIVAAAVQKKSSTTSAIDAGDEADPGEATEALLQWYMERLA
jgi:hypothetical protein